MLPSSVYVCVCESLLAYTPLFIIQTDAGDKDKLAQIFWKRTVSLNICLHISMNKRPDE